MHVPPAKLRWPALALWGAIVLSVEALVLWQHRPPAPRGEDAPASEFSAGRALALHAEIIPAREPHPAGSAANREVRDKILAYLRSLKLTPEVQSITLPDSTLDNILVALPSAGNDARPLVLAAHYDSCNEGPGAADDGAGVVALLECARAICQGAPLKRPVYILLTDAEEYGLVGAKQFVAAHPLARRQPYVLNFDARGHRGPAVMYETHPHNLSVISHWSPWIARPCLTASHFTSVAESMPNYSDFRVFRQAGWRGMNFAIIHGPERYHEPDDTLENLSAGSVQHFGEIALTLTRAIAADTDELPLSNDDAVFFDLLGWRVVWFPESWSVPLAIVAMVLVVAANLRRLKAPRPFRDTGLCLAGFGMSLAACALAGLVCGKALESPALEYRRVLAWTEGLMAAYALASIAITLVVLRLTLARVPAERAWSALWLLAGAIGVATAVAIPGFSFLFLAPTLIAGAASLLPVPLMWRAGIVTAGAALVWLPSLNLLGVALLPYAGAALFAANVPLAWTAAAAIAEHTPAAHD